MNKFILKVTVLTLALTMAATAAVFAQYTPESSFSFNRIGDEIHITLYLRNDSVVNIPPTIGGLPVVGVGGFSRKSALTSVTIPDSVKGIGNEAFESCTALTSVTIGKGVWGIGNRAFMGCTALKSIAIPANVGWIGSQAFMECTALESITIADVAEIGSEAFRICPSLSTVTIMRESKGKDFSGTKLDYGHRGIRESEKYKTFTGTARDLVIYVPKNSVDAYKKEGTWREFREKIVAIGAPRPTPVAAAPATASSPPPTADQRDGELNPRLVGTWKRSDGVVTYTFNADGTGTYKGSKSTDPLTWITDGGNRLTTTIKGSTLTQTYIMNGNMISMTAYGATERFTKQ